MIVACAPSWLCVCLLLSLFSALQVANPVVFAMHIHSPTSYTAMWLGNRRSHAHGIIDPGGALWSQGLAFCVFVFYDNVLIFFVL